LAFVCAAKGYKLILTMPESMSVERRKMLILLGAKLILTPAEKGMKGAIEKALEIKKKNTNSFMPQQFENLSNPEIHEKTTAEEIWKDCEGKLDALIAGVGTGGTITGCARFLKQKNPNIKVFAVEPSLSPVLSGGDAGSHAIQGIGAGFIPNVLDINQIDEVIRISDNEAMDIGRRLAKEEGLLSGVSSGAAVAAALKVGNQLEFANKRLVVILPSFGERYLSTTMFTSIPANPVKGNEYL